jgi:hypothetical protein
MDAVLVGYFSRRRVTRGGWVSPYPDHPEAGFPAPRPAEELCSVSRCVAGGPDSFGREGAPWNDFGGFDSPEAVWQAVGEAQRHDYQVLAYRVFPALFAAGREGPLAVEPQEAVPLPAGYERLGFDAVELRAGWSFGCSPLSCNGLASEDGPVRVNRSCLIATAAEAFAVARGFSVRKPEPGPNCVVEVWRKGPPAAEVGAGRIDGAERSG